MSAIMGAKVTRAGVASQGQEGATQWWADGTTSYVIGFATDQWTWHVADWADTAVTAIANIRTGNVPEDGTELAGIMRDVSRLQGVLGALADELLLIAREPGPDGQPLMSWREIANEVDLHFTTARERHCRVAAGASDPWRGQLVAGTEREGRYPTEPTGDRS
jgi:hypothetical protein